MRTVLRATTCIAAVGFILAAAGSANATPMQLTLTATDLVTNTVFSETFTDSGTPNVINVGAGTSGAIAFTGEVATSTIGPPLNTLITDALTVRNTSATDAYSLVAAVSGMNFVGPVNAVALTGSGTWFGTPGSVMSLSFFDDPTNTLGGACSNPPAVPGGAPAPSCLPLTTPGNLVGSFTSPAAEDPTSSYSFSPGITMLAIPDTGPFSMTEMWSYTLAPGGDLVSRGQTETKINFTPEPASLLILGAGLAGIGLIQYRRKRG